MDKLKCSIPKQLMQSVMEFEKVLGERSENALFYWRNEEDGYEAGYYFEENRIQFWVKIREDRTCFYADGSINNWFVDDDMGNCQHLMNTAERFGHIALSFGREGIRMDDYVVNAKYQFLHGENLLETPEVYADMAIKTMDCFVKELQDLNRSIGFYF